MRYLVTGGSGFLGINLIRYLLERGHEVRSLDLEPFEYADCKERVEAIVGDIRTDAADRACEGMDVVVHCAAALGSYTPEEIRSTDVDGTRRMLEAAFAHNVSRFVFISSTTVYGIPDRPPLTEEHPVSGVGPYGRAKVEAEGVCAEFRDRGMCVPVIRPKSFIGPERLGVFALLYDWAYTGHGFPMLGDGSNRYQLLDVEDLCEAIHLCCTLDKDVVNDTFNIGADRFTTMREDYQAVLDAAGHGKKMRALPAAPAIAVLRALDALHLSPLSEWHYATASKDSFVSIERARERLGFAPKYSTRDALLRNYAWYVDHLSEFRDAPRGVSHRVLWKQGVLGLAKLFF